MIFGVCGLFLSCLDALNFEGNNIKVDVSLHGNINTTDVTAAVLLLANQSKTVDVTGVVISQRIDDNSPLIGDNSPLIDDSSQQEPAVIISFENEPKRLTKKAKYLTPSETSYIIDIEYEYYKRGGDPAKLEYEGRGGKTITIPLPLPREIVEVFIYRDVSGEVKIGTSRDLTYDQSDTGNPVDDHLVGQGSSPAVIPPENRDKMATFVVVNRTKSQIIDSVRFRMGQSAYTIGAIKVRDRQSIALGQGTWETTVTYGGVKLPTVNSLIVPSNDPQAAREHYLYFYLNNAGKYRITDTWPPGDQGEEDILPPDRGFGRGGIKIVNQTNSSVNKVTIANFNESPEKSLEIDYTAFDPPVPVLRNRIGYIDLAGTEDFPIEGHNKYRIDITAEAGGQAVTVTRQTNLKDIIVEIIITAEDIPSGGNPGDGEDAAPYGRGVIIIINEDNPAVTRVTVNGLGGGSLNIPFSKFYPPVPVWQNMAAQIDVTGTAAFPIEAGKYYTIKVTAEAGGRAFTEERIEKFDHDIVISLKPESVYIAGWYRHRDSESPIPCYWVDGRRVTLISLSKGMSESGSRANAIAVSGGNVYTAGVYPNSSTSRMQACYWVNKTPYNLHPADVPGNKHSGTTGIAVTKNGTIYVSGWYEYDFYWEFGGYTYLISGHKPCYWVINGTNIVYHDLDFLYEANGIAVSGSGVVYIAGMYETITIVEYELGSYTETIQTACYVAFNGGSVPTIVNRHDIETGINDYNIDRFSALSVVVSGGALYVSGYYRRWDDYGEYYGSWVYYGGELHKIGEVSSFNHFKSINGYGAAGIAVSGSKIYAVCPYWENENYADEGEMGHINPGYWEKGSPNWNFKPLPIPATTDIVSNTLGIAVTKSGDVYTVGHYGGMFDPYVVRAGYWVNRDSFNYLTLDPEIYSKALAVTVGPSIEE
jgi:hypothetical protein